ncbi:MAG: alpha/beta hydrolase family protein [Polyangiales bacterium]
MTFRFGFFFVLVACAPQASSTSTTPDPSAEPTTGAETSIPDGFTEIEPGLLFREASVQRGERVTTVWLYRPTRLEPGTHPLVAVAPGGSNLLTGMGLADGDRPEHLPYVRAGFLVVSYSLDGALSPNASDVEFEQAVRHFGAAAAGTEDARAAVELATEVLPVDPNRIFAAGHSSAATHALLLACTQPQLFAAVAAYAPAVDVEHNYARQGIDDPAVLHVARAFSPSQHCSDFDRPTLLFAAEDDPVIDVERMQSFHMTLPAEPRRVLILVPNGGHYQPMIEQGIPAAIDFFESLF